MAYPLKSIPVASNSPMGPKKYILVGGAITILKNMKVNGKDDIPYKYNYIYMENKKCLKPPTSI